MQDSCGSCTPKHPEINAHGDTRRSQTGAATLSRAPRTHTRPVHTRDAATHRLHPRRALPGPATTSGRRQPRWRAAQRVGVAGVPETTRHQSPPSGWQGSPGASASPASSRDPETPAWPGAPGCQGLALPVTLVSWGADPVPAGLPAPASSGSFSFSLISVMVRDGAGPRRQASQGLRRPLEDCPPGTPPGHGSLLPGRGSGKLRGPRVRRPRVRRGCGRRGPGDAGTRERATGEAAELSEPGPPRPLRPPIAPLPAGPAPAAPPPSPSRPTLI